MPAKPRIPDYLQDWITARKCHGLSPAHVQMARELGMNPKKLGKLDNHDQEPWKSQIIAGTFCFADEFPGYRGTH